MDSATSKFLALYLQVWHRGNFVNILPTPTDSVCSNADEQQTIEERPVVWTLFSVLGFKCPRAIAQTSSYSVFLSRKKESKQSVRSFYSRINESWHKVKCKIVTYRTVLKIYQFERCCSIIRERMREVLEKLKRSIDYCLSLIQCSSHYHKKRATKLMHTVRVVWSTTHTYTQLE